MTTARDVHALVLAGGAATRFGGRKLLAPWQQGVLLDGAIDAALASPALTIVLVTGANRKEVERAAKRHGGRISAIHAADHGHGLSASLRAGIKALPASADAVFVFLGDMPRVPHSMAADLLSTIGSRPAAVPAFQGQWGHPVLLRRSLFDEVASLSGDIGARAILKALGTNLAVVDTDDPGVLLDVDEPNDLEAMRHLDP
ncbi:nucleotidyltransferase family protein [Flaviflagellibacter deserti]|uniref:NTP transferase domain-containing protein n=1 Tax=Flaviflagellibacter deserti TaxID=2267266 RepID=A0ABV9Z639_9HYPH